MRKLETDLNDRVLRFDGVSILNPELVAAALTRGVSPSALRVTEFSDEVLKFNDQVVEADRLREASAEPINIDMAWELPKEYLKYDTVRLFDRVSKDFTRLLKTANYTPEQEEAALDRLDAELKEIEKRGMHQFIVTIIYVIDTFRRSGLVWGVGRGSSCACYILFVLGLHVVDCIKYSVPMEEFFHD